MAGTDARFDAAKFRSAIKFAMKMGFPGEVSKQITWVWNPHRIFKVEDSGGEPFEWLPVEVESETDISPLIVDGAFTFRDTGDTNRVGGTQLGVMDTANIVITLLDVDHDALFVHGKGDFPDEVHIDGTVYIVQIVAPPYALFDVTVFDVHCSTVDASGGP